ncbi:MAG: hypothetical protein JXR95_02705 [Deltaproteobacteria bacterium]|nr:hypothetical protein [Deltaproteobacteria bacterium]
MKKIFSISTLMFAVLILPAVSFAQKGSIFTKGTKFIGGEISFQDRSVTYDYNDHETDESVTTVTLAPVMGYFLTPNVALWGQLNYTDIEDDHTEFGLTVGASYYHPLTDAFYFYGGAGIGFLNWDVNDNNNSTVLGIELQGGALYMLATNLGVNAALKIRLFMGSGEIAGFDVDITGRELGIGYFGVIGFF